MIHFLMHDKKDNVAVVVVDVTAGQQLEGRSLDTNEKVTCSTRMDIPLGHKIALQDFAAGDTVYKYGCDIGKVVEPIQAGDHVHVHNLKTRRWA